MSNNRLAFLLLLAGAAFATNPDEASFRKFVEYRMKNEGSGWWERKVVSTLTALVYDRLDFKFFSIVKVPESGLNYLGIFGVWIPLPALRNATEF
jgi:hypothetical protein